MILRYTVTPLGGQTSIYLEDLGDNEYTRGGSRVRTINNPFEFTESWQFLFIHTNMNQITKVDNSALSSESESRNLRLFYYFGVDFMLVPQIANVRGWSKHRFRRRLWSVCMRWNQMIFPDSYEVHSAFSDIIFINEFKLFTPTADFLFFNLEIMILWFYAASKYCLHSLSSTLTNPHSTKAKIPILSFSPVENFI